MKKKILFVFLLSTILLINGCGKQSSDDESNSDNSLSKAREDYKVSQSESYMIIYENYNDLYEKADLVVKGTFVGDEKTTLTKEFDANANKDVINDFITENTFQVEKVYKGDCKDKQIKIKANYGYDDENKIIMTYSYLTPMKKGTSWVYFLFYSEQRDGYMPAGDYTGRYSLTVLDNMEKYLDSSDNEVFGLVGNVKPNKQMYKDVYEKIYK